MKPIQFIREALYRGLVSYLVAPNPSARVRRAHHDVKALLQPGDVILVAGKSRFSSLICRLTRSCWSHVAIYVGPGHHPDAAHCIVEADVEEGVRMVTLERLDDVEIQVVRASRLPEAARQELIDYLLARVGMPYDMDRIVELAKLLLLAPLPVGRWLSPRVVRSADPARAVCSTLVAHALFTAGVSIGPTPERAVYLHRTAGQATSDFEAALDYLVPGDFERLHGFVAVFDSRLA